MNPYTINKEVFKAFKEYHGIKKDSDVAEIMGISNGYFSALMTGEKNLNEHIRLRIQMILSASQDKIFIPNFDSDLFDSDHLMLKRKYGIVPLLPRESDDQQLTFGDLRPDMDPRHDYIRNKYRRFWDK